MSTTLLRAKKKHVVENRSSCNWHISKGKVSGGHVKKVIVNTDFMVVDNRIIDSKGRITISRQWIGDSSNDVRSFQVLTNKDGDILLRPEVSVPAREAWLYKNPKALASLQRGIQEAREGKGDVVDNINTYLEKL